jgi:uncharacterized protein DUF6484
MKDTGWIESSLADVVIGVLVGLTGEGCTPLVFCPEAGASSAIPARSVVDVHGAHIGRQVVLVFEAADRAKPIIVGVLRDGASPSRTERIGQVHIEVDGERVIVSASDQLVLRCGKASITLTKEGKVLLQGTYLSSRSSGVNRIKGGSVQIN